MSFINTFTDLEQKIEHLVSKHTKLIDANDALRREVMFLRRDNHRLQREQEEIEDRINRVIDRVQATSQIDGGDEGSEEQLEGIAENDNKKTQKQAGGSKKKGNPDLLSDMDDPENSEERLDQEGDPLGESYRT